MISALDAAAYLLFKQDGDEPDISNLKLLKLIYYAQGYSLALRNRPLFHEEMQAWDHGPVVPAVYQAYKKFNASPIPAPFYHPDIPVNEREMLDLAYSEYGQFTAWRLRQMSHDESPWKESFLSGENADISKEKISRYFREKLNIIFDFETEWEKSIPLDQLAMN